MKFKTKKLVGNNGLKLDVIEYKKNVISYKLGKVFTISSEFYEFRNISEKINSFCGANGYFVNVIEKDLMLKSLKNLIVEKGFKNV